MKHIAIIPARMGSSRFPDKPMKLILGIPMIEHVYKRTAMCDSLDQVYVATCDSEIHDHILSIGGKSIMTSSSHERCTDRCAEALESIEKLEGQEYDFVVMVQGDEPLTHPRMIEDVITAALTDDSLSVVNLAVRINTVKKYFSSNSVKVVVDSESNALYFSREPIPSISKMNIPDASNLHDLSMDELIVLLPFKNFRPLQQLGLILFKRDFLLEYSAMAATPLEEYESCDMMRVLENGRKLRMVETDLTNVAVDIPEDLVLASQAMQSDELWQAGYS